MNIQPLGDRVVLKLLTPQTTTPAGIVLPDSVDQDMPEQAEVMAIGTGAEVNKIGIKVSDKVLFNKYAGSEVTIDSVDYKVVTHEDILALIK